MTKIIIKAIQTRRKANIANLNGDVVGYAKLMLDVAELTKDLSSSVKRTIEREAALSEYEQWLYKREVYTKGA